MQMKHHASAGSVCPFYRPIQNQVYFSYEKYRLEKGFCQYNHMAIYMAFTHNMRANPQIFMDNGRLHQNYPGKFVGVERLVRATQWSEPINQPNLGGVARIFAPQRGTNANICGLSAECFCWIFISYTPPLIPDQRRMPGTLAKCRS
jgi:hypothetical protein